MSHPREKADRGWADVAAGQSEPWAAPAPLYDGPTPPPFPLPAAFPPALHGLRDFVAGLAQELQVPVDLVAMLVPAVVSACIAQKYLVEARPGWREVPAVWVLCLLDSGERKSAAFRRLTDPVADWEKDQAERLGPDIAADLEERQILEEQLKDARRRAGKGTAGARDEAVRLARELAARDPVEPPTLYTSDATSEALVQMMASNGERALVASPEADALDVMMGRYDDKARPNMGVWLKGYSGDRVKVHRRGRKPEFLNRPVLSVALVVQPESVRGLFASRLARGRGLLARFFPSVPTGMVGRRLIAPPKIEEHLEMTYIAALRRCLDLESELGPRIVRLSSEAEALFTEFETRVEKELARGGALGEQREWGAKLCGGILRIALALHCLEVHGSGSARSAGSALEINGDTMRAALAWAPYLIAHERIASGIAGCQPDTAVADRVLCWLERTGKESFSRRDCFTECRGAFVREVDDVDGAIKLLTELGYIRAAPPRAPGEKGGRRPSPVFVVNPTWDRGAKP